MWGPFLLERSSFWGTPFCQLLPPCCSLQRLLYVQREFSLVPLSVIFQYAFQYAIATNHAVIVSFVREEDTIQSNDLFHFSLCCIICPWFQYHRDQCIRDNCGSSCIWWECRTKTSSVAGKSDLPHNLLECLSHLFT